MSFRNSPIRGLQPTVKEFNLQVYALNTQNERLAQLLKVQNSQIQSLALANSQLTNTYQAQADAYRRTIQSLEKQLRESQKSRDFEYKEIKDRYSKLTAEEMSNLKSTHTNQMEFLFREVAKLRASIEVYQSKLDVKDHEMNTIKASYERELSMNASEINTLNKKIMQLDDDKLKEIKDLTNRRQLQKSRTSQLFNSRKESTQYIEKQLRKLNQQVLQKTIGIESLSRDLVKQKKRHSQTTKQMTKNTQTLVQDYQRQLKQKDDHFYKIENILKAEILQYKDKEIMLLNQSEDIKARASSLNKELQNKDLIIKSKSDQISSLKLQIEKIKEDHNYEINSLMKERRKKSNKSNLGSSRSLGSSLRQSGVLMAAVTEPEGLVSKMSGVLPMVKEEGTPDRKNFSELGGQSNIVQDQAQDQLARAIYHYDSIIFQLKKSHEMQIQYYKLTQQKSSGRLKEKQLELEDVLTRFSPLVKIHADQKTLEEDRKQRIDRHWKADLSILQIMLKKYKIRTF